MRRVVFSLLMIVSACTSAVPPAREPELELEEEEEEEADTGVPPVIALDAGLADAAIYPDAEIHADAESFPDATPPPPPPPPAIDEDPLSDLPRGPAQLAALCARNNNNAITRALCTTPPPQLTSIAELQTLLELTPDGGNNVAFALTGHTTSLTTRKVSPINPRAIVFHTDRNARADGEIALLGYARGDQMIELAVSPAPGQLSFYLLRYEQPCNANKSCTPAELLTPATDSGFTEWSIYEDTDLANTTLDCLSCHQPDGPSSAKILRMQELDFPWLHWFGPRIAGGRVMIEQFENAHGSDEAYGPIPAGTVGDSRPSLLQALLEDEGFGAQPNVFDTAQIEDELDDNGTSETWELLYQRSVNAEAIPPPYFALEVTDPMKLQAMTDGYAAFRAGTATTLPDITDVFLDGALDEMSIRPKDGLDGAGIIKHACGQCHNGRLDPAISRARFDATSLETMSRGEKDEAIRRLSLPIEDRHAMPPRLMKELSADERARAIAALTL